MTLHHPAGKRDAGILAFNAALEALPELRLRIGSVPPPGTRIELVAGHRELDAALAASERPPTPDWVAGVAIPSQGRIVLRLDRLRFGSERKTLVRHELAHLALAARLRQAGGGPAPRWFDEGVAQTLGASVGPPGEAELLRAALFSDLPEPADLTRAWPREGSEARLAYQWSRGFLHHVLDEVGKWKSWTQDEALRRWIAAVAEGDGGSSWLRAVTGEGLEEHAERYAGELRWRPDAWWALARELLMGAGLLTLVVLGLVRRKAKRRAMEARWASESPPEGTSTEELASLDRRDGEDPDQPARPQTSQR